MLACCFQISDALEQIRILRVLLRRLPQLI